MTLLFGRWTANTRLQLFLAARKQWRIVWLRVIGHHQSKFRVCFVVDGNKWFVDLFWPFFDFSASGHRIRNGNAIHCFIHCSVVLLDFGFCYPVAEKSVSQNRPSWPTNYMRTVSKSSILLSKWLTKTKNCFSQCMRGWLDCEFTASLRWRVKLSRKMCSFWKEQMFRKFAAVWF